MAIRWTPDQSARVAAAIKAYPAESGRCATLVRHVLPVALERDANAHGEVVRPLPGAGRFLLPRAGHKGWRYHATTSVEQHRVDALTEPTGTEESLYLHLHFHHPEALRAERWDQREP